jgi:hypothetical protein
MTQLQFAHKGRRMNVWENYYIQFFQHNNTTVKEHVQKERNKLSELIYGLQPHHACAGSNPKSCPPIYPLSTH